MSQMLIFCMSITSSLTFSLMTHPMSMGIMLLLQTILICFIIGTMSVNAWFSYILFLVLLGGVLVLFIYMTSVASNELFSKMGYLNSTLLAAMAAAISLTIMLMDPASLLNSSEETMQILTNPQPFTNSMFNYPNNILTCLGVLYLFLTLIVVVKMTESQSGPLRTNN